MVTDNLEFKKDVKNDLEMIHLHFTALSRENPIKIDDINMEMNISAIAKPNHRKRNEFVHNFFKFVLKEIEQAIYTNQDSYFIILCYVLECVFFNQEKIIVKININIDFLECINSYMSILKERGYLKEILAEDFVSIDVLKFYGAFNVFFDKNSDCIFGNDVEIVEEHIKYLENILDNKFD